jgi:hypothetical protein
MSPVKGGFILATHEPSRNRQTTGAKKYRNVTNRTRAPGRLCAGAKADATIGGMPGAGRVC